MGVIPTEDLILGELQQLKEEARKTNELLKAINANLVSIKGNTRKTSRGIMGG